MEWIQKKKPSWNIIYLADNDCFPYGNRSSSFLKERVINITKEMIKLHNPDLGVIACNTLSVTALDVLRSRFDLPFVGVVPAVKPAAESGGAGNIGVLATENTVKGKYLKTLIHQFAPSQNIETRAASDLVRFVEHRLYQADEAEIQAVLAPYIKLVTDKQWKTLVLGCTHFILLKPWFEKWLPSEVSIVDSTEGVGRRILQLLPENPQGSGSKGPLSQNIFYITSKSKNEELYRTVADQYQMILSTLEVNET
jgi:glutamate racemase